MTVEELVVTAARVALREIRRRERDWLQLRPPRYFVWDADEKRLVAAKDCQWWL